MAAQVDAGIYTLNDCCLSTRWISNTINPDVSGKTAVVRFPVGIMEEQ
jgi:hypothetical protein